MVERRASRGIQDIGVVMWQKEFTMAALAAPTCNITRGHATRRDHPFVGTVSAETVRAGKDHPCSEPGSAMAQQKH